jgi:Fic family protein
MLDLSTLTITSQLLKLIAEIDEFKGAWRLLQIQDPERLESLRHVATIESIGSSTRIEGSQLSNEEIEALLGKVGRQSFATRDQQEVAGYAEAMDMVFADYNDIPLTENHIKQLHSALLRHSKTDERHRGEYKKHTNHVEAFDAGGNSIGVIFETTSPFDTPGQMQDLVRWTQTTLEDKSQHPLVSIGIFKVVFLAIHPFQDGNGRLSRVLTTFLLLKSGYRYIPYSSLESIIERNKDAYYLALQRTQKTLKGLPDWLPWLIYFLNALKRQKDHLDDKLAQENPYANLLRESEQIMHYVDQHQRITTKKAEQVTGALRPTVKNRLSSLVSSGFLKRHGKGRGSWYGKA